MILQLSENSYKMSPKNEKVLFYSVKGLKLCPGGRLMIFECAVCRCLISPPKVSVISKKKKGGYVSLPSQKNIFYRHLLAKCVDISKSTPSKI